MTNGALGVLTATMYLNDNLMTNGYVIVQLPKQTAIYAGLGLTTSTDPTLPLCTAASCTYVPTCTASYTSVNYLIYLIY